MSLYDRIYQEVQAEEARQQLAQQEREQREEKERLERLSTFQHLIEDELEESIRTELGVEYCLLEGSRRYEAVFSFQGERWLIQEGSSKHGQFYWQFASAQMSRWIQAMPGCLQKNLLLALGTYLKEQEHV